MKEVLAPAGERTKVLHIFSDSIPQKVRFGAAAADGGPPPGGLVEVVRSPLLMRRPPERYPLEAEQIFHKGFTDTNYVIYVTPEADARITFRSRHFEMATLFIILGGLAAFALVSAGVTFALRGGI